MSVRNVSIVGLAVCFAYFIITILLIAVGGAGWVTAMELVTVLAGLFMVPFIVVLPFEGERKAYKLLAIIAASGCLLLTSLAHVVNLTVTTPLLNRGVEIPSYFQIGQWPSVEMAVDYLGWGLFMGLSFLTASLAMGEKTPALKFTTLGCGALCILGFLGAATLNENFWYIAPLGYGIGTAVICVELLASRRAPEV